MRSEPFALAAVGEHWKIPHTDQWIRTFCTITTAANELVGAFTGRKPHTVRK